MSASTDTAAIHAPAPPHRVHPFRTLLRREFWEHRGGFFWAPAIAGALFTLFLVVGLVAGSIATESAVRSSGVEINGQIFQGLDLAAISQNMTDQDLIQLGEAIDMSLLMGAGWPYLVLALVVFFYCLGALYDERRDRSVLFWKSLPVSDTQTVLSKLASATLVAPVITVVVASATMFAALLVASVAVWLKGGNPFTLLWLPSHPLRMSVQLLAAVPVFAIWSLPTAGWLLLCSAWARSKPFLWAIAIPLFSGLVVSLSGIAGMLGLEGGWFWKHVVGRLLLGTLPAHDLFYRGQDFELSRDAVGSVHQMLSIPITWGAFARPETWAGAAAGAVMIFLAIRLRRWRDEG